MVEANGGEDYSDVTGGYNANIDYEGGDVGPGLSDKF